MFTHRAKKFELNMGFQRHALEPHKGRTSMTDITGRVAFITGAASGIGYS
ncbi:MAG: hypothetical protein ACI92E_002385, partial [Oceanicoccus sp.]